MNPLTLVVLNDVQRELKINKSIGFLYEEEFA
jgi:hypothetical protein